MEGQALFKLMLTVLLMQQNGGMVIRRLAVGNGCGVSKEMKIIDTKEKAERLSKDGTTDCATYKYIEYPEGPVGNTVSCDINSKTGNNAFFCL